MANNISILRVENGWIITPEPENRFSGGAATKVARTSKELCEYVEEWANPQEKPDAARKG